MPIICEFCGREYEGRYAKVSMSRHRLRCRTIFELRRDYKWTKELLEKELLEVGTVADFIKKYPRYGKSSYDGYELFHEYGIDISVKAMQKVIRARAAATLMRTTGLPHNFCKQSPSRQQWQARLLAEEGITNVFQRESVKSSIRESIEKSTGASGMGFANRVIADKYRNTCFESYGGHPMQNEEVKRRHSDAAALRGSQGTHPGRIITLPHKKAIEMLQYLGINHSVEFPLYNTQKLVGYNKYYYSYDIRIEETNKLIEVNGDYWHANPASYISSDIFHFSSQEELTAEAIWKNDEKKRVFASLQGYELLTIWESAIKAHPEAVIKEIDNYASNRNSEH